MPAGSCGRWSRTLAWGALGGLGVGVVLPLLVIFIGGAAGMLLRGRTQSLDIGQMLNDTAPVLLAFLDLPHTIAYHIAPGHTDSAAIAFLAPVVGWALLGMVAATIVRLVRRR